VRNRLRKLLTNRRQARRHKAQREVSLLVGMTIGEGAEIELVTGRTRDLSQTGLSMSLPLNSRQRELVRVGSAVRILLMLPVRTVNIRAEVIHSEPLDEHDPDKGGLIGVQITQMASDDETSYKEYLDSLK
jgi:hypothetical protein